MAAELTHTASAESVLPTILIVDDHPGNLLALESVLGPLGYPLMKASSGVEALATALPEELAMIVMDVHMPGLDGYGTMARFRERERLRDVPVIFLTAVYDEPEHRHRGYALGAIDYISKPFDPQVLRAKVGALVPLYLRGQRAERLRSREKDRMKDLFLGAVGHDLRNPLNTIALAAKILSGPGAGATQRGHAQRIERAVRRMDRLIEDILDLARGQFADGIPLNLHPTDLGETCRTIVAEFQLAHPERSFDLEVLGEVTGEWDPDRLARLVSNLVANAIQHGSDGPVRVGVAGDGERATLVVHNRGRPIRTEALTRLFEPFSGDDANPDRLGLGLYIVREIVRAHRGEVAVTSTGTAGTFFTVTLPKRPLGAAT